EQVDDDDVLRLPAELGFLLLRGEEARKRQAAQKRQRPGLQRLAPRPPIAQPPRATQYGQHDRPPSLTGSGFVLCRGVYFPARSDARVFWPGRGSSRRRTA